MRVLISIFVASFLISIVSLSYMLGQKSVDVSLAALTTKSSCVKSTVNTDLNLESKETISFPLIRHSKAASVVKKTKVTLSGDIEVSKESIDTTVIHAIRKGKWSEHDNRVFMFYISHLNKKERISVLKQMNKAINYQQMKIGSYIPNF